MKIIYEDNSIILCEKPSGTPSQKDKTGDNDLLSELNLYLNNQAFIVHRLDRTVGGLILFAKNKRSAAFISKEIQDNDFKKYYTAVVNGEAKDNDFLEDYLIKNQRLNISKVVHKNNKNAKKALLEYRKINSIQNETDGFLSLLQISLLTGRHHQIRVQLSNSDLPIWGDRKYNDLFKKKYGNYNIALWSSCLEFRHPITKKFSKFEIEPPKEYPFNLFLTRVR